MFRLATTTLCRRCDDRVIDGLPRRTPPPSTAAAAQGQYALCDYAVCIIVPGTTPPVAQCGCYAFNGISVGSGPGILDAAVQAQTEAACT